MPHMCVYSPTFFCLLATLGWPLTWASVPLANQRTFGHAVKNGPLPAHTEVTTFEHNCTKAPCVITQIHVPSIYPPHGEAWNWTHGVLNFYIDGDKSPTISITLLELAGESRFNNASSNAQTGNPGGTTDGGPWGIGMMGRTAKSGGVYSTVRIPFGKSFRSTIQAPASAKGQSTYWMIIRGLEAHAVVLGDLILPAAARLRVQRLPPQPLSNLELVTLANVSRGTSGALLRVNFDATGPNFGYLEACMRLVTDGRTSPLFLSSGAEDYFLSASYFDEGMFKTENSGLTFFKKGTLGAYKTHSIDPVLFHDGMQLIFRRCERTSGCGSMDQCPNQFCPPGAAPTSYDSDQLDRDMTRRAQGLASMGTNYSEYYLGSPGQTCTAACADKHLKCNPTMDLGDVDTMIKHLNITTCWRNGTEGHDPVGMKWYAPDQPGYIPLAINPNTKEKEPNYRECMGFVGYPNVYQCEARFPTNARVCHCTATVPPTPPSPAPGPKDVVYSTLVWLYEWPNNAPAHPSDADTSNSLAAAAMKTLAELGAAGLITAAEEDAAVDRLLTRGTHLVALLSGFNSPKHYARAANHLRRYLDLHA